MLNNQKALVLRLLAGRDAPTCGSELIEESPHLQRSSVYVVLHRLENDRLVAATTDEGNRVQYQLTKKGRAALQEFLDYHQVEMKG